ncbi:unnamed protein product, partial [Protopolystoma xenopodis]
MALSQTRQLPFFDSLIEIHGELSRLNSRKKWRPYYGLIKRERIMLVLIDLDKGKEEQLALSKCEFFPIHHSLLDRPFCFGILLYGANQGEREEFIISVDIPRFPFLTTSQAMLLHPFGSSTSTSNVQGGLSSAGSLNLSISNGVSRCGPLASAGYASSSGSMCTGISNGGNYSTTGGLQPHMFPNRSQYPLELTAYAGWQSIPLLAEQCTMTDPSSTQSSTTSINEQQPVIGVSTSLNGAGEENLPP